MFDNPFTPLFGGRPDFFFGRERILSEFEKAFISHGSDYRALFVSGTRGFGKTALLEQLSRRAAKRGWDVIDVNADNALQSLFRQVARFVEVMVSIDPEVEVKVLGSGGSASGRGTRKTTHYTVDDLDMLLLAACEKAKRGVFVTIDEIQKVPLDDVSRISGAFQMASRKGHEVMIAVAGLPYSHRAIAQHDGCTYLRRAVHEELGLFTADEVRHAFESAFSDIDGLAVDGDELDSLVHGSSGHPYMMQLLGYNLIDIANVRKPSGRYSVTVEDVSHAEAMALADYEQRALAPIVDALGEWEVRYLRAMVSCLDENLEASTASVARELGRAPNQVTYYRDQLIRNGIILSTSRGVVRFAIPLLRQFIGKTRQRSDNERLIAEWRV